MKVTAFIAARLRFKGKIAIVSIAMSFLVMILAVTISSGFRKEIRRGVSSIGGDIQLTSAGMNYISEEQSISSAPPCYGAIDSLEWVTEINPVIYRAGIVKSEDLIQGVLFKGISRTDTLLSELGVSIPSRLADILNVKEGDAIRTYFVSDRVKVRKFEVREIYQSAVDADDRLLVYADIGDMRRLNGWAEGEVSAIEIMVDDRARDAISLSSITRDVASISFENPGDEILVAASSMDRYPQLFDWLDLIDFNVVAILVLMTIVAGFNMISGLLILLFQNISTIGTLKSMGMTDKSITSVFLKVSSNLVLKGMSIGNAIALLFCLLQSKTHFLSLDPANYFISYVPVNVNLPMILLADVLTYGVIMLLLVFPSRFISKIDPAQTIRTA